MTPLFLALPFLALAVLGAHFFRAGEWLGLAASVLMLALLFWRRTAAWRVLQVALVLGALEWLWTAARFAQERMLMGRPWGRMALILGGVALVTLAAAAVLRSRRLRSWFRVPAA